MELIISDLGLPEADSRRLRTMSGMAATSGLLKHRWVMRDPGNAHLLVVSSELWRQDTLPNFSGSDERQTVAVLAGDSDPVPEGFLRLRWPIRYEDILSMLNVVEGRIDRRSHGGSPQESPAAEPVGSQPPLVELATIIRQETLLTSPSWWRVRGVADHSIVVVPEQKVFYFPAPVTSLSLEPDTDIQITSVGSQDVTLRGNGKPLRMLQWLVGLRTASTGLLPWVNLKAGIQLSRYPPFTELHHAPVHRRIATALSRPCADLEQIRLATHTDVATVTGFINAVSLCGFLKPAMPVAPATAAEAGTPVPLKRSLLQTFRRALGIEPSHE